MLRPGYTAAIIAANCRALIVAGHPPAAAQRYAFQAARKSYAVLHPGQKMPARLKNPVRSLKLSAAELADIRRGAQKALTGKGAAVRRAGIAYTEFTGHDDPHVQKIAVPDLPEAVWQLGLCDGMLYTTIRDGKTERYIHRFKKSARPLLNVSSDGRQLFLHGGAYRVTERGIEDNK